MSHAAANIAAAWSAELSVALARPVTVTFGRARRNVIVVRTHEKRMSVRLNERFGAAPREVRAALEAWLRNGKRARKACETLDAYVDQLEPEPGSARERAVTIRADGAVHDLRRVADEVIASEFAGRLDPALAERITWGRRSTRKAQRSIQLGSYDPTRELVRIHPVLDQPAVPESFVRYVVFHELLHAADPDGQAPERRAGERRRRVLHGREFRRLERLYPGYDAALRWQATHLGALLKSARTGRPMSVARGKRGDRGARRDGARRGLARARAVGASVRRVGQVARAAQGWLFPVD